MKYFIQYFQYKEQLDQALLKSLI